MGWKCIFTSVYNAAVFNLTPICREEDNTEIALLNPLNASVALI